MMKNSEISEWTNTLPGDADIAIDDGGLMLVEVGGDAYLEVGGIPEEGADEELVDGLDSKNETPATGAELVVMQAKADDDIALKPHIIVTGDPGAGFEYYGPFEDFLAAHEWIDNDGNLPDHDWWISPLHSVKDEDDEQPEGQTCSST